MADDLKQRLAAEMQRVGAYEARMADPRVGFEHVRPGQPPLPLKLCAFEAGLGVYGRSGLILHPELGNGMVLGAFLTDAAMSPDGRSDAADPCGDCRLCAESCPAGAYGPNGEYHGCWSRERCDAARARLIAEGYSTCNLCWIVCPAGTVDRDSLFAFGAVRAKPLRRLRALSKGTIAAQRRDLAPPHRKPRRGGVVTRGA